MGVQIIAEYCPSPCSIMAVLVAEAAQKATFRLGYPSLREHQLEAVSGSDVFVVLPIGYGKSLCFACLPSCSTCWKGLPLLECHLLLSSLLL